MLKSKVFIISLTLLGISTVLNWILENSAAPQLGMVVAGAFLLGLAGLMYTLVSALRAITEWQESRA